MIRQVTFRDILDAPNSKELLAEYAAECSLPELGMAVPRAEEYEKLEKFGGLQCFGIYNDGEIVGFATLLSYIVPHYGKKIAATESIFVARRHRAKFGHELVEFIAEKAKQESCSAILFSAPTGSRFSQMLALTPKYRHTNDVYLQSLE